MLIEEIKKIKSGKKELREFAMVMGGFFALLSIALWFRHKPFSHFAIVSGLFLVCAVFVPAVVLKPIQRTWMTLALLIGSVMTRVILTVLFFLVITPVSLISRLFGGKYLDLSLDRKTTSYWERKEEKSSDPKQYENQF